MQSLLGQASVYSQLSLRLLRTGLIHRNTDMLNPSASEHLCFSCQEHCARHLLVKTAAVGFYITSVCTITEASKDSKVYKVKEL